MADRRAVPPSRSPEPPSPPATGALGASAVGPAAPSAGAGGASLPFDAGIPTPEEARDGRRAAILDYAAAHGLPRPHAVALEAQVAAWTDDAAAVAPDPRAARAEAERRVRAWLTMTPSPSARMGADDAKVLTAVTACWGRALVYFDALLDAAGGYLEDHQVRRAGAPELDALSAALLALYARAWQAAGDVRALVLLGRARGAKGTWRTVHELSVFARAITRLGAEAAERYVAHADVDELDLMESHNAACGPDGDRYSDAEIDAVRVRVAAHVARFGPAFTNPLGWAAGLHSDWGSRAPSVKRLEKFAGLAHERAAYLRANSAIHGNLRGLTADPGQPRPDAPRLVVPPSPVGVASAVEQTVRSLWVVARELVRHANHAADREWFAAFDVLCERAVDALHARDAQMRGAAAEPA